VTVALLKAGYRVALAGRRESTLQETLAREASGRALTIPTDVSDAAAVDRLFGEVCDTWGHVDLLFNNAGVAGTPSPVEDVVFADWQAVIGTNLTGAFLCAQAAFRSMKQGDPQGGRIINNGSLSAHVPRPHAVAYTATKHAITGLTKALSLEGRAFNIACGQIDIGNAASDMTAAFGRGVLQAGGVHAVEPTIDVRHAVDAVLYMASLPLEANVHCLTVMATSMPYIGRG